MPAQGSAGYTASKHSIVGLTKVAALECATAGLLPEQDCGQGQSWQRVEHPCEIAYRGMRPTSYLDASHSWTMRYQHPPIEGAHPIYPTSDSGHTWNSVVVFDVAHRLLIRFTVLIQQQPIYSFSMPGMAG